MNARPQTRVVPYQDQPELANTIAHDATFSALEQEILHERKAQAMRWWYVYTVSGYINGQTSLPFNITIEQGTDFKCLFATASVFSYDSGNASFFPLPNPAGSTAWACRGLSVKITDTRASRDLTSGFVAMELLATPGWGLTFQRGYPMQYFFNRNTKIRFDIRNRDSALRLGTSDTNRGGSQQFEIALHGYKYLTPGS